MDYLFVYGTLMKTVNNSMSRFLHTNSELIGNAYFQGKLYDLVSYPGAIISNDLADRVYGDIFKINDTEAVFRVLDDYEGIGDGDPNSYEYIRKLITAYLEDGTVIKAWFYAYNFPTSNLKLITSGKYLTM